MVDRNATVYLKGDISDFNRAMLAASATTKAFASEIDTSSDRMTMLVQGALALGPALVPIGASAIPALAGLTNQVAFATAGAGAAVLAFSGVGDALKALNEYELEPSAANFQKLNEAMREIGPAGREFARFLQDLRPELQGLQDVAQAGLFPGLESGISEIMEHLPQAERIVWTLTKTMGDLAAEAGTALGGPRWAEFFDFIEREARPALIGLGRALGNLMHGFAELWMAFDPISDRFSESFLRMSRDFDRWAGSLDQTAGFESFMEYIERVGPKVWDTLGAVGNALVEIIEAAAPVGEVALPVIEAIADSIAMIADSPLGPAVVGIAALTSAYGRLIALSQAAGSGAIGGLFSQTALNGFVRSAKDLPGASRAYMDFGAALDKTGPKVAGFATTSDRMRASMRGLGATAGMAGGLAFVMSDLDDKFGMTNTAMGAMVGMMAGPLGAAIGGSTGAVMDLMAANNSLGDTIKATRQIMAGAPQDLKVQEDALEAARRKVQELEDEFNSFKPWDIGNVFGSTKDSIEGLFGKSDIEEARESLDGLEATHRKNIRALQDQKFEQAGLAESMSTASGAVRDQTEALLENIAQHEALTDQLIGQEDASNAWREGILTLTEDLKENGRSLSDNTLEGLANQDAIRDRVKDLRASIDADIEAGASQADLADKLADGREAILKAGEAAGISRKEMKKYVDQLGLTPESIATWVKLHGEEEARRKLRNLKATIDAIPRSISIAAVASVSAAAVGALRRADGGPIVGPGGPRDDVIPALLSNGEYVVKASSVDKYGVAFMNAINAGRFADGGYAGGTRYTPPPMSSATASAASYGPASFTGDLYLDSGEFLGKVRGVASQEIAANNQAQEQAVLS